MPSETSSNVGAQVPQEQTPKVGAQPTTSTPASEGQVAPAQEHKVEQPSQVTAEQIAELLQSKEAQAAVYRQAQSMKDKELLQERLRRQQEEERRRIEQMDDEELGHHVRSAEAREKELAPLRDKLIEMGRADVLTRLHQDALAQISDKKLRDGVDKKAAAGEYKTFPEFFQACVQTELGHRLENQLTKKEKELRDAISKELMGEQVGEIAPDLGRGLPTSRTPKLHGDRAIAAGLAERLNKKK